MTVHGVQAGKPVIGQGRAREIGADIEIESEPGDGTRINLQFKVEPIDALMESTG